MSTAKLCNNPHKEENELLKKNFMQIPLRRFHDVATLLAIITIFISMIVLFLYVLDEVARWDILPSSVELWVFMIGWFTGILAIGTTAVSILLSLYAHAHRE